MATWLRRAAVVTALVMSVGCSATHSTTASVSTIFDLHRQYLDVKKAWLQADSGAIQTLCAVVKATPRRQYSDNATRWQQAAAADPTSSTIAQRDQAQARLGDLDDRLRQCSSLDTTSTSITSLQEAADKANTTDAWDSAQESSTKLVLQSIEAVNAFPTSTIRGLSYGRRSLDELAQIRADSLKKVATIATKAVDTARDASGTALSNSKSAEHEIDKQMAENADKSYTQAAVSLASLQKQTNAGPIFTAADETLSNADSAIGYAQHQGANGATAVNVDVAPANAGSFAPLVTPPPIVATPTPPPLTNPVGSDVPDVAAVDVVRKYYDLWNSADYRTMYTYLSAQRRKKTAYDKYAYFHGFTDRIDVSATAGDSPSVVHVHIESSDHDKNGIRSQSRFEGTWYLVVEDHAWKLNDEQIKELH